MNMKLGFSRVVILLMIVGIVVASNSTMAQQGEEKQIKLIYVIGVLIDKKGMPVKDTLIFLAPVVAVDGKKVKVAVSKRGQGWGKESFNNPSGYSDSNGRFMIEVDFNEAFVAEHKDRKFAVLQLDYKNYRSAVLYTGVAYWKAEFEPVITLDKEKETIDIGQVIKW